MKIKTLAKWHKYYNPIFQWFTVFMMLSTIAILTTWIVNYEILTKTSILTIFDLANIFTGYVFLLALITIPFGILGIIFRFINLWTMSKLQFNLSNDKKFILLYLILRKHKSNTLNLELEKIIHIYKKQSHVYQEFNETDFPYLNKLFRRLNCSQETHNNNNIENISSNDLNKLNISNPMLLTFEQVDNELNNLINQNILNQNPEYVKNIKDGDEAI